MRGASHNHGTKPCLPLMCLGPLGIGRPTAGSPRRACSHWALHQSATSCMEPCRCHCPWPSSTDCTFCRRHCVYLAGGARQDGLREYKLSLTWTKKMSDNAWLFLPQEQQAASEGALREGGRGLDANKTEAEAALASSQAQSELGSRVEHGRDLRCCIAPRRFRSHGRHASPVASCLRFQRFRQLRRAAEASPRVEALARS